MTQTLVAIAAFVALVGGVIFGVSKAEQKSKQKQDIELISKPFEPSDEPVVPSISAEPQVKEETLVETPVPETAIKSDFHPPAAETFEIIETPEVIEQSEEVSEKSDFQAPTIEDPWENKVSSSTSPEEEAQTVLDLGNISQTEAVAPDPAEEIVGQETAESPIEDSIPSDQLSLDLTESIDASGQDTAAAEEFVEPRAVIGKIFVPATIQDPKRPNSEILEDLSQEILAWGQSQQLKHLPKLIQFAKHSDSVIRSHVAIALGKIAASHSLRGEVERTIPVLGKLSQDPNLQVRQFAIQALGSIQSDEVLPYLKQALRSPSCSVMKAASTALQNLKLRYGKTSIQPVATARSPFVRPIRSTSFREPS